MKKYILFSAFILSLKSNDCMALTVSEIIASMPELSRFYSIIVQTSFYRDLRAAGDDTFTLFAPNNNAFQLGILPSSVQSIISNPSSASLSTIMKINNILKGHTVHRYMQPGSQVSELQGSFDTALGATQKLFFRREGETVYVNGARIIPGHSDLVASNGYVHTIDAFLYEIPNGETAKNYIINDMAMLKGEGFTSTQFSSFLNSYSELVPSGQRRADLLLSGSSPITVFLPSDASMRRMNQQQLNVAKRDATLVKQIVESHIIPTGAYHEQVLRDKALQGITIPSLRDSSSVEPKIFSNHLEVSNQCAKGRVVYGNITVFNGVIHIIDGLLGYVFNSLDAYLDEQGELSTFTAVIRKDQELEKLIHIAAGDNRNILPENMLTLFTPVNDQTRNGSWVSRGNIPDSQYSEVARMHTVRGRLDVADMTNGSVKPTLRTGYHMKFYQIMEGVATQTYAEVDNVRALITVGDMCALNGVMHKIDHPLGVPTDTLYEAILRLRLERARSVIATAGLSGYLDDMTKRLTFFVPADIAFELMAEDTKGAAILDRRNIRVLQNVLYRHALTRLEFLNSVEVQETYTTAFNSEKITVVRNSDGYRVRYGTVNARVLLYDMREKNGILHVIDRVLFSDNPNASEWTAKGTRLLGQHIISLILCSVLVRRIFL